MASPTRPGVEVIQEITGTPAVTAAPNLVPMVVGVCNQIVTALDDEGALDPEAKYPTEQYNQASMMIPQGEFPDPRDNIDEINVYEDQIETSLYFGGSLYGLERGSQGTYGQAFLKAMNFSRKAALRATLAGPYSFDATVGDVLTLAFNVVNPVDTGSDIVVTLVGASLSAEEVATEINDAVGSDVASVFIDEDGDFGAVDEEYLQLTSEVSGATSSITLRQGTSALKKLFGASFDDGEEYRVEGAGFRGQDDEDNDLSTPWIEFYRGAYLISGVDTAFPGNNVANTVWAGTVTLLDNFIAAKAAQQIFLGPSATVDLVAATSSVPGDRLWADGVQVGDAEIIKLEPSRFKLGKINTSLSTYDDEGRATTRVYDTIEVNTPYHSNAFAPVYAYFLADGLVAGEVVPEGTAASITGVPAGVTTDEREAIVQSSAVIDFTTSDLNLASLTLDYEVIEDGVSSGDQTYTFAGGPFENIADLVTNLTGQLDGVIVDSADVDGEDGRLVLKTAKTGADQGITVKSTGTANTALNFSPTAATADTGKDTEYVELAEAQGELISLPMPWMAAAPMEITVSDSKGVHVVSATADLYDGGSINTMALLVAAIADAFGGAVNGIFDGGIKIATVGATNLTEAYGQLTITTLEGGASVSLAITASDRGDGFRWLGFYDNSDGAWAEIESTGPTGTGLPVGNVTSLEGVPFGFDYDDGGGVFSIGENPTVATLDGITTMAGLAEELNSRTSFVNDGAAARSLQYIGIDDAGAEKLIVRTILGGDSVSVAGTLGAGNSNPAVLIPATETASGVTLSTGNADDAGGNTLLSTALGFYLDDNPYLYEATFTTNSLQDALDEINELVNGATDVATEDSGAMVLTSLLLGSASKVEIDETSSAAAVLGLAGDDLGDGRPNPDFWVDLEGAAHIGPSILRNGTTGQPFSLESSLADVYIAYVGLRLDVTAAAEDANILTFTSVELMEASIGPIDVANPLALGVFLAQANAPAVDVSALGLDDRNAAAPEGTIDAWARALELLESKEVYTIAPLSGDNYVNQLIATHVGALSLPTNRGERICFIWTEPPTNAVDLIVSSGSDGEANGTDNSITLENNPSADIIGAGINLGVGDIPVDEGLYLELLVVDAGATELRRYSVREVNGVLLNFRTTFVDDENIDGFYSTTEFDGGAGYDNLDWSLKIRGEPLVVTGTDRPDLNAVTETAAEQAEPYTSRRVYYLYGDSVVTSVNGIEQRVPLYYASAGIAGMIAQLEPQQPFTNVPIAGFSRVYGTDDTFSENQLDTIADGGRYVLVTQGSAVASRHQRSTDTTSIENRELSITKSIDWLAKGIRDTNRVFIGRYVINQGFLDQLTMANEGFLSYSTQLGVVAKAKLTDILQDADEPDTILINVEATPQYPCNKIRVTIVA